MDSIFHVSCVSGLLDEQYCLFFFFFLVYGHCAIYYTQASSFGVPGHEDVLQATDCGFLLSPADPT